MDEVHYLADRFRGAVWEEVILQLPEHVALVSLSATVSNAEEFGDWLVTVRGDTTVVVDEHRPVPLWQHMMVGNRLFDLFGRDGRGARRPGHDGAAPAPDPLHRRRASWRRPDPCGPGTAAAHPRPPAPGPAGRYRPPSRVTVIDRLDREGCCRRSRSSSAGPAATRPSASACAPGCG